MENLTGNIGGMNTQMLSGFTNRINIGSSGQDIMSFRNVNQLDSFMAESSTPLKGVITKIQSGQPLEQSDFSNLAGDDLQLAKDLQTLTRSSGGGTSSSEGISTTSEVADKFSNTLGKYLNNINTKAKEAENAVETFATGGDIDIHTVMIAAERASLSMNLAMQLQGKLLQAYNEIKNIRV